MPPDPEKIRAVLDLTAGLERDWLGKVPETDRRRTPWMPFPVPQFLALVLESMPAAPGNRFLDVGCGPGSKMLLARDICGLDVTGVEVVPEYAAEAFRRGLSVIEADAASFAGYGNYDIIWLYRPFRDPDAQAGLEKLIWDEMAPGAIVICAGLEALPPFIPVLDDLELRRGIWMKQPAS